MPKTMEVNTKKNVVGFTKEILKDGYGVCTPVINGEPCPQLKFGYCGEADYEAASKMVSKVLSATDNDVPESMDYIMKATKIAESEISPDEQVEIEGIPCIIDYNKKKIYNMSCEELASADDLTTDNEEAIKLLLVERAKPLLEDLEEDDDAYNEGYDDGYQDGQNELLDQF